jgi:hypothetical protein
MEFEGRIHASEAAEALWRALRAKYAVWLVGITVLAAAAIRPTRYDISLSITYWIVAVMVVSVLYGLSITFRAFGMARRNKEVGGMHYTVSDDGISLKDSSAALQLKWAAFKGFVETRNVVMAYFRSNKSYVIIPKRCIPEPENGRLVAMLSKHLPKMRA